MRRPRRACVLSRRVCLYIDIYLMYGGSVLLNSVSRQPIQGSIPMDMAGCLQWL